MDRSNSKLVLATNNPGKIEEFRNLLLPLVEWEILAAADLKLDIDPEENGSSYEENAQIKAEAFCAAAGMPSIADDSGLELEALKGAPGLFSARFSPKKGANAADRRQYLLEMLNDHPRPWKARFVSTVCLAMPKGEISFAEGECLGEIIPDERGEMGFGYDPIFLVQGKGKTMAQMTMAEKNFLSHRALATLKIIEQIRNLSPNSTS